MLFTRAADLVRQLLEARDARELTRLQQRLLRVDVLIVDEVGFVPFERVGGELLFNLITDRYERRATVVTTNLAFAEWVTVFAGDEKLTTALLDRLAHHATVITTKGKSYRMRKRRVLGLLTARNRHRGPIERKHDRAGGRRNDDREGGQGLASPSRGDRGDDAKRQIDAAMEMTRLWKSQNDFHSRLEISHRTRDSHIPTADHRCFR